MASAALKALEAYEEANENHCVVRDDIARKAREAADRACQTVEELLQGELRAAETARAQASEAVLVEVRAVAAAISRQHTLTLTAAEKRIGWRGDTTVDDPEKFEAFCSCERGDSNYNGDRAWNWSVHRTKVIKFCEEEYADHLLSEVAAAIGGTNRFALENWKTAATRALFEAQNEESEDAEALAESGTATTQPQTEVQHANP